MCGSTPSSSRNQRVHRNRWSAHTPSIHARILVQNGDMSPTSVARVSGASLATCKRLVAAAKRKTPAPAPKKRGRPFALSPSAVASLKMMATKSIRRSNAELARRLEEKGHPRVSLRTVGRTLAAAGFVRVFPSRKPRLTERHKRLRLEWCLRHQHWKNEDWNRVVFSDESSLVFRPHRQKVLMRRGSERPVVATDKFPSKLMIWGGISARGATPVATIAGTVDSLAYQRILEGYLLRTMSTLYPEDVWILQQDNAPCHTSASTRRFFQENGIEVMDWPPNSPDLNPIENLWGIIKKDFAPEERTTVSEWRERVVGVWERISQERYLSLIESMPRRIAACIAAHGGHTKY